MSSSSSSSPPEWDQLLAASQKNLPDTIRTLVSEGVDPNHANQVGQSALHIAAIWAHVESLQVLIELGANPNATNAITGATPLHCAVQSSKATSADRRILTLQTLLDAGADPSRGDFYGTIPFDYCEDDDVDAKALLQPEIPPIFEAVQKMDMERLAVLLLNENDAAAVVQSRHAGITPLLQLVDDMLEEDKNNGDDSKEKGEVRLEMMRLLLENGADPNATPAVRRNGHLTVQQKDDDPENDPPLSKICLQLGNAYCRAGQAADDEDDRIIIIIDRLQRAARLLLKESNDAVVVSASTQQLLHNAARRNQVGMMQFWTGDLKVSPNVRGRQGMTPLQFAARSGQTEAVEFLLSQHDIDMTIRDDRGQTALDAARLNNKNDIVALLEQHTITSKEMQ